MLHTFWHRVREFVIRDAQRALRELRMYWWRYLLQSLAAGAVIFMVLLVMRNEFILASIGATAFILFAMPHSISAQPRNVIGGHLVGVLVGSALAAVPHTTPLAILSVYAGAVALSTLVMVVTDTEHPPAAGTAMGALSAGLSLPRGVMFMAGVIALALIQRVLRRHLRDLT